MPGETWVTVKTGPGREIVSIQYGAVRSRPIPPQPGHVTVVVPDDWMDGRLTAENRQYFLTGPDDNPGLGQGDLRPVPTET